jgi:peptidyl-prolyl cis-trans isomerase C
MWYKPGPNEVQSFVIPLSYLRNAEKEKKVQINLLNSKNFWICSALVMLLAGCSLALASDDQPVAKIGSQVITEGDLKSIANAVPEQYRGMYFTPEGHQKTVEHIVNIYVLADEAEKQGLDKTPDVAKLLQYTRKNILARIYLDKLAKDTPVPTEDEAKEYYEKNKSQYVTRESAHMSHILVKTEKEAKEALDRVTKKGDKFSDVATQISICPSKAKGGNLDWMPKGSLVKEIEEVAFSAKLGQPVGPVQSKYGYHILLIDERRPEQQNSFDQVKDYIMEQLKAQRLAAQYEKETESLKKNANVEIMPAPAAPAAVDQKEK